MMIEREIDDFTLLWTEEVGSEEEQIVRKLAGRIGLRAQLLRYADYGIALAVSGGIALLVLTDGSGATALSALLLVLAMGWSTWKRQALWEVEMNVAAAGGEALLEKAEASGRARLKRTNVSLSALMPAFLLSLWFGARLYHPELDSLAELQAYLRGVPVRAFAGAGIVLIGLFAFLLRSRRSIAGELQRIGELRDEYRLESRRERSF
ncbi:MAG TPA: hypothetical protein VGB59_08025 [Allosphingosinicella sp.]|jgi:hypothetical protein